MRTSIIAALVAGLVASLGGSAITLVQHSAQAGEVACVGERRPDGKCDIVWLNYSVESRKTASYDDGKRVNCPKATTTQPECYQRYEDTKSASSNWGSSATTPLVPKTSAGPLEFGGVFYGLTGRDARAWTGLRVTGLGSGSIATGAGRNGSEDPFACFTIYGNDETPDHSISGALADAGLSDDRSDYDTDVQFCGEFLRGIV